MPTARLVQHTHWDREWYFTVEDARVLSDYVFTQALEELERNPNVTFCLDGQSSIVDEYVEINPEKLPIIQKLVKQGRLFVGPWFTQTDALLVDAESILRNLVIGISDTRKRYGEPMMLGYLPDTFGFNAQLPTLLQQVGIDAFLAWRGIDFDTQSPSPYFKWKGLGNREVFAAYFPFGYMTGMMTTDSLEDIPGFVNRKLAPMIDFLAKRTSAKDILIPAGIDQKNMVLDYDHVVDRINEVSPYRCEVSDYPSFFDSLRGEQDLPCYRGELREPVYSRVHRSIGSVRTWFKQANFDLEQSLIRSLEPMLVIADKAGISISPGLLDRAWKKVLENQAHDSMGGCVSDNVAEDIIHRTKEARELVDGLLNLIEKRIAEKVGLEENQILLFNTDPVPFSGMKKVHILTRTKCIAFSDDEDAVIVDEVFHPERPDAYRPSPTGDIDIVEAAYYELDVELNIDLPALGYRVISFMESDKPLAESVPIDGTEISRGGYTISFHNGVLDVTTPSGRHLEDFVVVTDAGNAGDTYDYSPLPGEKETVFRFESARASVSQKASTLYLEGEASIPCGLEDREGDCDNECDVRFRLSIALRDSGPVECRVSIDNTALSHRMRLKFSLGDDFGHLMAGIQNGFVRTEIRGALPESWREKYVEKPVGIEIFDKSLSAIYPNGVLSLFIDGLREYEIIGNELFVTLFATTGQLGKADLAWRPGRASGDTSKEGHVMMPTPLAQEIGEHCVIFGIEEFVGAFDEQLVATRAHDRLSPNLAYQKQRLNLFIRRLDNKIWPAQDIEAIPSDLSVLDVPRGLIVSALAPSRTIPHAYIVRLANPSEKSVEIPEALLRSARCVNALEEPIEKQMFIAPYDYLTLLFA